MAQTALKTRTARADSLQNRERLVATARQMLAADDAKLTLEAVARKAGLGIGTVYRHFPSREALYETLYREDLAAFCARASALAAARPPFDALRQWLSEFVENAAENRGMRDALSIPFDGERPIYAEAIEMLARAADTLLVAAHRAGVLRRPLSGRSLVHMLIALCSTKSGTWREVTSELVEIFLNGLAQGEAGRTERRPRSR